MALRHRGGVDHAWGDGGVRTRVAPPDTAVPGGSAPRTGAAGAGGGGDRGACGRALPYRGGAAGGPLPGGGVHADEPVRAAQATARGGLGDHLPGNHLLDDRAGAGPGHGPGLGAAHRPDDLHDRHGRLRHWIAHRAAQALAGGEPAQDVGGRRRRTRRRSAGDLGALVVARPGTEHSRGRAAGVGPGRGGTGGRPAGELDEAQGRHQGLFGAAAGARRVARPARTCLPTSRSSRSIATRR